MAGLARICFYYGSMKVNDLTYVYDYVADKPVLDSEMPFGSERHAASERKRAELLREQHQRDAADDARSKE